jgi:transposase InsO family protein
MTAWLRHQGYQVNHKRVERLMNSMGLQAAQPKVNTSRKHTENKIYSYLLSGVKIACLDHVWSADITYIRLAAGFLYLMAIMNWHSRFVLAWRFSSSPVGRRSLTLTKGPSLPACGSLAYWRAGIFVSAWTAADESLTTSLWNGCGDL